MSTLNSIERAADELAIRNLLAELAWQADSTSMTDIDSYVACFTPDAVWEVPGDVRSGREDIRAGVTERRSGAIEQGIQTAHFLACTTVTFDDDDNAQVKSYLQTYRLGGTDGPTLILMGWYHDWFRRTAEGWKLHRRHIEFA
jgi:uncharacterized protein (TIGR02246 family)